MEEFEAILISKIYHVIPNNFPQYSVRRKSELCIPLSPAWNKCELRNRRKTVHLSLAVTKQS